MNAQPGYGGVFYLKGEDMAYTPELSKRHSGTLRRVAWALKMPITQAIEKVFDEIVKVIDREMVVRHARIIVSAASVCLTM